MPTNMASTSLWCWTKYWQKLGITHFFSKRYNLSFIIDLWRPQQGIVGVFCSDVAFSQRSFVATTRGNDAPVGSRVLTTTYTTRIKHLKRQRNFFCWSTGSVKSQFRPKCALIYHYTMLYVYGRKRLHLWNDMDSPQTRINVLERA